MPEPWINMNVMVMLLFLPATLMGFHVGIPGRRCEAPQGYVKKFICITVMITVWCLLFNPAAGDRRYCRKHTISPTEPYFLSGQNISLTCHHPILPGSNRVLRHLLFKMGKVEEPVDSRYITWLNGTAIRMDLPLTENMLSRNDIFFFCWEHRKKKNETVCLDHVAVRTDYEPVEPTNIKCRVYNWNNMTCTWDLGQTYLHKDHIDVDCDFLGTNIKYMSDRSLYWGSCPNQTGLTCCTWNRDHYTDPTYHTLLINVTNTEVNVSRAVKKEFNTIDIVEPAPVTSLVAWVNATCMTLTGKPADKYRSFIYNVTCLSSCGSVVARAIYHAETQYLNTTICGFTPHTVYTCSVRGRVIDDLTKQERGYWSKPAEIRHKMEGTVPAAVTMVTRGLFEQMSESQIRIYYTPLLPCEAHASWLVYEASIGGVVKAEAKRLSQFHLTLSVDPVAIETVIQLQAWNKFGMSKLVNNITIYKNDLRPAHSDLVVEYIQVPGGCRQIHANITGNITLVTQPRSHTLVWCKGSTHCEGEVEWRVLEAGQLEYLLNECRNGSFRYGLITHGHPITRTHGRPVTSLKPLTFTGIKWAVCVYQNGKVPTEPLKNVKKSDPQPDLAFKVEWTQYGCDMGYITHYLVSYCTTRDGESCGKDGIQNATAGSHSSSLVVREQTAGTQLLIWVRGVSRSGAGPSIKEPLVYTVQGPDSNFPYEAIITSVVLLLGFICVGVFHKCIWRKIKECCVEPEIDVLHFEHGTPLQEEGKVEENTDDRNDQTPKKKPDQDGDSGHGSMENTNEPPGEIHGGITENNRESREVTIEEHYSGDSREVNVNSGSDRMIDSDHESVELNMEEKDNSESVGDNSNSGTQVVPENLEENSNSGSHFVPESDSQQNNDDDQSAFIITSQEMGSYANALQVKMEDNGSNCAGIQQGAELTELGNAMAEHGDSDTYNGDNDTYNGSGLDDRSPEQLRKKQMEGVTSGKWTRGECSGGTLGDSAVCLDSDLSGMEHCDDTSEVLPNFNVNLTSESGNESGSSYRYSDSCGDNVIEVVDGKVEERRALLHISSSNRTATELPNDIEKSDAIRRDSSCTYSSESDSQASGDSYDIGGSANQNHSLNYSRFNGHNLISFTDETSSEPSSEHDKKSGLNSQKRSLSVNKGKDSIKRNLGTVTDGEHSPLLKS